IRRADGENRHGELPASRAAQTSEGGRDTDRADVCPDPGRSASVPEESRGRLFSRVAPWAQGLRREPAAAESTRLRVAFPWCLKSASELCSLNTLVSANFVHQTHPEPQTARVLRSAGGMISAMDCTEFSVGTVEETLPSPALWMIFRRKRGSQTGRRVGHRAQRIRNPSRSASGIALYPCRLDRQHSR